MVQKGFTAVCPVGAGGFRTVPTSEKVYKYDDLPELKKDNRDYNTPGPENHPHRITC